MKVFVYFYIIPFRIFKLFFEGFRDFRRLFGGGSGFKVFEGIGPIPRSFRVYVLH